MEPLLCGTSPPAGSRPNNTVRSPIMPPSASAPAPTAIRICSGTAPTAWRPSGPSIPSAAVTPTRNSAPTLRLDRHRRRVRRNHHRHALDQHQRHGGRLPLRRQRNFNHPDLRPLYMAGARMPSPSAPTTSPTRCGTTRTEPPPCGASTSWAAPSPPPLTALTVAGTPAPPPPARTTFRICCGTMRPTIRRPCSNLTGSGVHVQSLRPLLRLAGSRRQRGAVGEESPTPGPSPFGNGEGSQIA